jgi:tetratricopeptide (TPR) repeat protein
MPRLATRTLLLLLAVGLIAALCLFGAGSCKYSPEKTLKAASEAWASGDYQKSAELYQRFLEHAPLGEESIQARLQLANVYYLNLHRYEDARVQYREFLSQAPSSPEAYGARERLAEVLSDLGKSYEAIAEFENLAPPEEAERRRIRLRIADLYYDQKNYSQALTEYAKVTEGVPYDDQSEEAYLREASIYQLSRGQYMQAMPVYRKLASESQDAKVRRRALYNIADCYEGMYQFDEAIKVLREIKDQSEQSYIARKITELEQRSREVTGSVANKTSSSQ